MLVIMAGFNAPNMHNFTELYQTPTNIELQYQYFQYHPLSNTQTNGKFPQAPADWSDHKMSMAPLLSDAALGWW